MIYVDDASIPADVLNKETGQVHSSNWFHLITDQLDPTELHEFAAKLGLRRSYFQPGKRLGRPDEHDPGGDHYDLTKGKRAEAIRLGARPVSTSGLSAIAMRKSAIHRFGFLDIAVIVSQLAEQEGTFALAFYGGDWTVAINWGKEAEDSPMAGAAAYGTGDTAQDAVYAALQETGWLR